MEQDKLEKMLSKIKKISKDKQKQIKKRNDRKLGIKEKKRKIDKKVDDKYDIL